MTDTGSASQRSRLASTRGLTFAVTGRGGATGASRPVDCGLARCAKGPAPRELKTLLEELCGPAHMQYWIGSPGVVHR